MIPEFLGIPCIYGDVGKAEFRNLSDLTPEFLGIPCTYEDVGKAEFRNRRDLIPGADLSPECVTLRNRMCSPLYIDKVGNKYRVFMALFIEIEKIEKLVNRLEISQS